MLIAICGKSGSGKSSIAKILCEKDNFIEYTFASPLKKIAEIFGFENEEIYGSQKNKLRKNNFWKESFRDFAQIFGTELCRKNLGDYLPGMKECWIRLCKKFLNENKDKNIIISDLRFPDEAKMLRDEGFIIFKTIRECKDNIEMNNNHSSENSLDLIDIDYIIDNNNFSIEENYKKIKNFLKN
jgi:hypothetical protein